MCDSRQTTDGAGSEVIDSPTQVPTTAGRQLEAQGWETQPLACSECGVIGAHTPRCSASALPVAQAAALATFRELADEARDEALARGQSVTRLEDTLGRAIAGPARQSSSAQHRLRDSEAIRLSADATTLERAAELLRDAYTGPGPSYGAAHDCDRLASWLRREAKKLSSGG